MLDESDLKMVSTNVILENWTSYNRMATSIESVAAFTVLK